MQIDYGQGEETVPNKGFSVTFEGDNESDLVVDDMRGGLIGLKSLGNNFGLFPRI
jgi:hypothetical protein